MNNLSSYCGLVDAKIRASDKDLPVHEIDEISCENTILKKNANSEIIPPHCEVTQQEHKL